VPEREPLTDADPCVLATRWLVDERVMQKVVLSAQDFKVETGRDAWIISGYRTREEQRALEKAGRPTAPDNISTHRWCPATGVDVSLGPLPVRVHKAVWGRIAVMNGLRWGGGGAVDDGGIPMDWAHVDAGPRQS